MKVRVVLTFALAALGWLATDTVNAQVPPLSTVATPLIGEVISPSVDNGHLVYVQSDPVTSARTIVSWSRGADGHFSFEQEIPGNASRVFLVGGKLLTVFGDEWRVYSRVADSWDLTQTLTIAGGSLITGTAIDGDTLAVAFDEDVFAIRVGATAVVEVVTRDAPYAWHGLAIDGDLIGIVSDRVMAIRRVGGAWVEELNRSLPDPTEDGQIFYLGGALDVRGDVLRFIAEDWNNDDVFPMTYQYDPATGTWPEPGCQEPLSVSSAGNRCRVEEDCIGGCVDLFSWPTVSQRTQRGDVAIRNVSDGLEIWDWNGARWALRGFQATGPRASQAVSETAFVGAGVIYSMCPAGGCELAGVCATSEECSSGFCVDGVCCERACRGVCKACDVPGSEGRCTAVTGAPHGVRFGCSECDAGVCVDDSLFSDGDACAVNAACDSGNCVDGVCCDLACEGACEACDVSGAVGTCSPVTGSPHGERDCASCGAGTCLDGDACDSELDCGGAPCVDGVCCDRECGPCERCDQSGSLGACTSVSGTPRELAAGCSVCEAGTCRPAARGEACVASEQCDGDPCVDGYCCERTR